MLLKGGTRILALTGAPFDRRDDGELIIGLIERMGNIEGSISFRIKVDGSDATSQLVTAIKHSKFSDQIRIIATNGVALGGLNIMDFERISKDLGVGLVSVTRKRPRKSLLKKALSKDSNRIEKTEILDRIYSRIEIVRMEGFYVQLMNVDEKSVRKRFDEIFSLLRTAHIIASGIGHGESRGRI